MSATGFAVYVLVSLVYTGIVLLILDNRAPRRVALST